MVRRSNVARGCHLGRLPGGTRYPAVKGRRDVKRRSLRIAFVTPEFVTEVGSAGGLASYLTRMSRAFQEAGHEPEIFTLSEHTPEVLDYNGIRIERVQLAERGWPTLGGKVVWHLSHTWPSQSIQALQSARALARAFKRSHREKAFHLLQSADYMATGLFVGKPIGCRHVSRCSWARDLFTAVDNDASIVATSNRFDDWFVQMLERASIPT